MDNRTVLRRSSTAVPRETVPFRSLDAVILTRGKWPTGGTCIYIEVRAVSKPRNADIGTLSYCHPPPHTHTHTHTHRLFIGVGVAVPTIVLLIILCCVLYFVYARYRRKKLRALLENYSRRSHRHTDSTNFLAPPLTRPSNTMPQQCPLNQNYLRTQKRTSLLPRLSPSLMVKPHLPPKRPLPRMMWHHRVSLQRLKVLRAQRFPWRMSPCFLTMMKLSLLEIYYVAWIKCRDTF